MRQEYLIALKACKNALCQIGVKGRISIDRLLGCIIELQDEEMTPKKLQKIIDTLNSLSVGGPDNLEIMLSVLTVLEQIRDGTFDASQVKKEDVEQPEGSGESDG